MHLSSLFLSAVITFLLYGLYHLALWFSYLIFSPLRQLQGLKNTGWINGHAGRFRRTDETKVYQEWIEEYGSTFVYNGMLNTYRLFTTDLKALNHVLNHADMYPKSEVARYMVSQLLGRGVIFVEGDQHRQQRRIMNPAFGLVQVRALTDIFVQKSVELRDLWMAEIKIKNAEGKRARVDVTADLSKMTLDVIGLAGFDYDFHALDPKAGENELSKAFGAIFRPSQNVSMLQLMMHWIPILRAVPTTRDRKIKKARETMRRIGSKLLEKAKVSVISAEKDGIANAEHKRDLFSLLVHANMAHDVPESQRLSDDDVLAQVPTFLIAGHETTSTAVTWALFALTQAPGVQEKLRTELTSLEIDNPTMDDLNALPYLDAVVRETLRLYSPLQKTWRVAAQDDVIPVSKPYMDKHGVMRDGIKIGKGDAVMISIANINTSKELWGDDAHEFKPERWESLPDSVSHVPGVWGHMLTFLGGPHACIGYRFSLVEMKALLFVLLLAFQFELAVPPEAIQKRNTIIRRAVVVTQQGVSVEMPMLIKPAGDASLI